MIGNNANHASKQHVIGYYVLFGSMIGVVSNQSIKLNLYFSSLLIKLKIEKCELRVAKNKYKKKEILGRVAGHKGSKLFFATNKG